MPYPTKSMPSPLNTFQKSQVLINFQETQGSKYIPNTQELESQDFPSSLPVPNGSELYCNFHLDYLVWVNNVENNTLFGNLKPVKPPQQLRMSVTDMSFSLFKTRVYNHVAASQDHLSLSKLHDLIKVLTNVDKAHQLQWRCSIKNCERVVNDNSFFKLFMVVAGIQFDACNVLLFMDKPCSSNCFKLATPPASGQAVRFAGTEDSRSEADILDGSTMSNQTNTVQLPTDAEVQARVAQESTNQQSVQV
ncbi:uncharacterized protein PGTG_18462 [Puccinia graminis f. sp. tritici CRL 75-36-700-3]|uniref:Uncharacterized protein n=1 Tax=Puccinia graminis f. sp. tritici (strain CRL 75-36-700-3 / race SCCL) TaxID=418459 RepID=E3L6S2_PUCGT|nr:uncharacterized protein PGTG_18462 [Puccinia graminis f. sp. tritici CRL 75-36-700-3]EFP92247.1 hypothetical protein PGTG_18462 [Puccinia graminis f. sp. tritici CRL 75-36-700-3]